MRGGNAQDRRRSRRAADRRMERSERIVQAADEAALLTETLAEIESLVAAATGISLGERDEAWDSGAAEKSYDLPADSDCYLWKDPDGDPAAKSSYKLPFVSKDGGKHAVWKAITAVAAVLQGGRGGVSIPDSDVAAVKSKVASYYSAAAKKYDDDSIKVPWADGEASGEATVFALALAEVGHASFEALFEATQRYAPDFECVSLAIRGVQPTSRGGVSIPGTDGALEAAEMIGLVIRSEGGTEFLADPGMFDLPTPEVLALERFDTAFPHLFAVGDVIWGPEEGFCDLLCDINEALGSSGYGDSDEPAEAAAVLSMPARAVDVSVKLDKALIHTDDGMMVAPLTVGTDGEPIIGDRDSWTPVESGWVEATPEEDGEEAQTAAARLRFTLSDFSFADVALPDEHKPGARLPRRNPSPKAPEAKMAPNGQVGWEALFLPEATLTDDGRAFAPDSVSWRDLPLTLMAMTTTSAQGGHDGAEAAGRIDKIWRDGNMIKASGVFDLGEYGQEIARMVADGTLRGLSVDTAIHEFQVGPRSDYFTADGEWIERTPDATEEEPDLLDMLFGGDDGDSIFVVTKAVIGMATVCPFPAFAEANISLQASGAIWRHEHQAGFIVTCKPETTSAETLTAALAVTEEEALTAGAAGIVPVAPPAAWFENPGLEELTALTITDDGRIYGHAWSWEACHLSFPDACVLAPRSETENSYFHLGEIECADGEMISVGKITLDTGHAGARASRTQAAAHYDNTGTVAAHARCGEDEFGGWVAGAINPELSEEKLRILRGAVLSGDWRAVRMADGRSNLELVALLAVNVPGFPVPRVPRALVAGGDNGEREVLALVAAGIVVEQSEEETLAEIAALGGQASGEEAA